MERFIQTCWTKPLATVLGTAPADMADSATSGEPEFWLNVVISKILFWEFPEDIKLQLM